MAYTKKHSEIQQIMSNLPYSQGGNGRHKCAACAYEAGRMAGYNLKLSLSIDEVIDNLEDSQAGEQRHKSPLAAFARGYYDGICQKLEENK